MAAINGKKHYISEKYWGDCEHSIKLVKEQSFMLHTNKFSVCYFENTFFSPTICCVSRSVDN